VVQMNELIVLFVVALGAISISATTYYHTKYHIQPYFHKITSWVYAWIFSLTLTAYAYTAFIFVLSSIHRNFESAGFAFVLLVLAIICGVILQVYSIIITESKYKRLAYPIFYSVSIFGFFPILWVLFTIHLALIFDFFYEKEKAKID